MRPASSLRSANTADDYRHRSPPWVALAFAGAGALLFVASLVWFLYAYLVRFGRLVAAGPVFPPLAADVALFSAFALHHSLFARTGLKAWVLRLVPPSLERSCYTWVASALFLAVCVVWRPVPGLLYSLPPAAASAAYLVQAAGIVLTILGSRAIDVLDLAGLRPLLLARAGRQPGHVPLVTGGVFRLVRHPLYFGWLLFVFAAPHMTATRAVFAAVSTAYLALAIPLEERGLARVFGAEYAAYRRRVPWRMLPFIY